MPRILYRRTAAPPSKPKPLTAPRKYCFHRWAHILYHPGYMPGERVVALRSYKVPKKETLQIKETGIYSHKRKFHTIVGGGLGKNLLLVA